MGILDLLPMKYRHRVADPVRFVTMHAKHIAWYCLHPKDPDYHQIPIIINSGYRSPEVNRLAGGSPTSNHLTGCAVDIRCMGKEQMIRYAGILLDIADGTRRDFDELILEQRGNVCWLHFAVRPKENRRRIAFDIK